MRFYFIILISVLLFISCNKSKTLSVSSKKEKVLVSNLDKELSLKKGTLFYKNSPFEGAVYELYIMVYKMEFRRNGILINN